MRGSTFIAVLLIAVGLVLIVAAVKGRIGNVPATSAQSSKQGAPK